MEPLKMPASWDSSTDPLLGSNFTSLRTSGSKAGQHNTTHPHNTMKTNTAKKTAAKKTATTKTATAPAGHPMIGRRCIIRTYSAGVHIGIVARVSDDAMGVLLTDAIRLWEWRGGGLSLSAVANNGIKGGRVNRTGEVYLTNAIEYIPVTEEAHATFAKFIED